MLRRNSTAKTCIFSDGGGFVLFSVMTCSEWLCGRTSVNVRNHGCVLRSVSTRDCSRNVSTDLEAASVATYSLCSIMLMELFLELEFIKNNSFNRKSEKNVHAYLYR